MYSKLNDSELVFDEFCSLDTIEKLEVYANITIITPDEYSDLIDRVLRIFMRFNSTNYTPATLFLTVKLLDLFLSRCGESFPKEKLDLCGVACLYLAAKQQQVYTQSLFGYVNICDNVFSGEEICGMELEIFITLNGRVHYPTIIDYTKILSPNSYFAARENDMVKLLSVASLGNVNLHKFSSKEISVALNWMICSSFSESLRDSGTEVSELENRRADANASTEKVMLCCRVLYEHFCDLENSERTACLELGLKNTSFSSFSEVLNYLPKYLPVPKDVFETLVPKASKDFETPVPGSRRDFEMINTPAQQFISLPFIDASCMSELGKLGEGAHGEVLLVKINEEIHVLKKSKEAEEECDGLTVSFIRELNAFIAIHIFGMGGVHTVKCNGFFAEKGKEYIFLEQASSSLSSFLKDNSLNSEEFLKAITELFGSLAYLHSVGIMHRDIKPQNILVFQSPEGEYTLKICDLGLVRGAGVIVCGDAFTYNVCTMWYRAPEVFLKNKYMKKVFYGPEMDVWSMVCVVMEIVNRAPVFQGYTRTEMLWMIANVCGLSDEFKEIYRIPKGIRNVKPTNKDKITLGSDIPVLEEILRRGFECDPSKRIRASQAYTLLIEHSKDKK